MRRASAPPLLAAVGLAVAIAWVGEASGLVAAWAVVLGAAAAVGGGDEPVMRRGVPLLGGAAIGWALARATSALREDLAVVRILPLVALLLLAVVLLRRGDPRTPAWPVLLGAGALLGASQLVDGATAGTMAPVLSGLAAGLVPFVAMEVVVAVAGPDDREPERPAAVPRAEDEHHA